MKIGCVIFIILVYLGANYYVFYRAWQGMPPNPIGQTILIGIATVVIASLFLAFLGMQILPIGLVSLFYKISTSWLIILIFLVLGYLMKDIMGLFAKTVSFIPNDAVTRYTKDNWIGFGFMLGFITLLMLSGYFKYRWKVRVEIPVYTEKTMTASPNDSLQSNDTLKIVGISDLHLGYSISEKELLSWIELINKEKPDAVIIAGDIIDNSLRPLNAGYYADCLKKIDSKYGTYACLGNHEYISGEAESEKFIQNTGIHLLRDSTMLIDNKFYIVGREDRSNKNRKPLEALLQNIDQSKPIIVLDHQPYNLEEAANNQVDLQFSGHTHGGQVFPMNLIVKWMYENPHGLLKKDNTNIYVSSGIGIWGGKFRIGTQSEYVVMNLITKTKSE